MNGDKSRRVNIHSLRRIICKSRRRKISRTITKREKVERNVARPMGRVHFMIFILRRKFVGKNSVDEIWISQAGYFSVSKIFLLYISVANMNRKTSPQKFVVKNVKVTINKDDSPHSSSQLSVSSFSLHHNERRLTTQNHFIRFYSNEYFSKFKFKCKVSLRNNFYANLTFIKALFSLTAKLVEVFTSFRFTGVANEP